MSSSMNTILIIGGTSGIGLNFAKRFRSMGKTVIITGRREQKLDELKSAMPGIETYKFDMSDLSSLPSNVETVFKTFTNIDTVWINGGVQYSSKIEDFSSASDSDVIDEVTTNVTAPMILSRHLVPLLLAKKDKETNLMFTSSGLGFVPVGRLFPVYCPTKSAIHAYAVGLRQCLKDSSVNVIEIVPPFVTGTDLGRTQKEPMDSHGVVPMAMDDFVNDIFKILDSSKAKDLKEVAAGTAVARVQSWRDSIGAILAKGLGG